MALAASLGSIGALTIPGSVAADPRVFHASGHASKKAAATPREADEAAPHLLLATLVQTHTDERILLDAATPSDARFEALLSDRVTGASHSFDPKLIGLLRSLATRYAKDGAAARIELVSGYRSPKLNEMLRKKGHHVASRSQHSLGNAVDFRVVLDGETKGIDPRELERAIRAAGWTGGVGVYLLVDDWFVHADVGPSRSWRG
jgi:uncharacterized protein YcbK (DUF882 family)